MPENKVINNGYLRTPPHTNENGNGSTLDDAHTDSPLLGVSEKSASDMVDGERTTTTSTTPEPKLISAIPSHIVILDSRAQQKNTSHTKVPSIVQYAGDRRSCGGGGGIGGGGSNVPLTRTSLQRNNLYTSASSDNCMLKEPKLRRRLFILAASFMVLGTAVGALSIYFAGSYRCFSSDSSHHTSLGENNYDRVLTKGNVCLTEECVRTASSLLTGMDRTADPCEDFFQYACGTWNKKHVIPEDKGSISTFEVLADQQHVILKGVLEEPINDQDNQATTKAKIFYKSCMDIPQIRKTGEGRLKEVLSSLGGWPVIEKNWKPPNMSIEYLFGTLRGKYSESVLIELYVGADDKNSSNYVLHVDQLSFILPSKDYYLKAISENELQAYHKYMTRTAILMGADPETAGQELADVLQFEILLVNASLPEADRHDTSAIYRKLSLNQLQKQVPQLNWTLYLQTALGKDIQLLEDEELVSLAMPYLVEMGKIVSSTDQRVIHNYVMWRLVMSIMSHMIDDFQRERVEFRRVLFGIQSERMRWSQCVEWTNKKLGLAVGMLFIRENFNQDSKDTALKMIHTIREAFNELLAENYWMDDETRAVAKEKADAMNERIGFPDILTNATELEKEYINLTIIADDFMDNVMRILKWDSDRNLQLLRMPVDKDKWTTEPAVVNAFYNPNKNDIVIPAGILQPLFYSNNFPKSLNYGGIGVVIGHEITHGFDDKGRLYDKDGNMMQWWNNVTIEAFQNRTQCIIDQYSKYKIDEVGMYMNGRMTQGENIADNGGLKQSFRAYRKWVKRHGEELELPGLNLSHDQLFFLNYAQIWCGSNRPEDALTKIHSATHSPGFVRVLGPLSNSKDFADAYHCKLGSPMNPVNKCSVW